jgi:hypothetical protein
MNHAIYIRGVANMAVIYFQFEEFLDPFRGKRKSGAFWKVVNQSMNSGKIDGANKKFHAIYPNKKIKLNCRGRLYVYLR